MRFKDLGIIDPILKAIEQEGYTEPTDIQIQALPILISGRDLLGSAQTGTGKTAAFAIPVLQHILDSKKNNQLSHIRALVLAPTRELAAQINESFKTYGRYLGLRTTVVFGGVSKSPQIQNLKSHCDILVATPGRLLDLMEMGMVAIDQIEIFVLDEADQMLDMGFLRDIKRIVAKIPSKRQTMMFSATMPPEIEALAGSLFVNPVRLAITPVEQPLDTIKQSVYFVGKKQKADLLLDLWASQKIKSLLVFTRTKHGANKLTKQLQEANLGVGVIHGNKSQPARIQALNNFKNKKLQILVATDIASRGLDIHEISHVINYDLPEMPEVYLHRMGRTGRAGFSGTLITLCSQEELPILRDIERHIGMKIPVVADHPFRDSYRIVSDEPEPRPQPRQSHDRRPNQNVRRDPATSSKPTTHTSYKKRYY
jgi:ATP-dependent RNA helicase RhlE